MIKKILNHYKTKTTGLTTEEIDSRISKYGLNKLKEEKKKSPIKLFLSQFYDALIILLMVAAIASYCIGDSLDAIIIAFVIVLNSIIGFFQEYRAEKAMEKLKNLVSSEAVVKRNKKVEVINGENLTIGDIVVLEEGDKVPADLILIETYDLKIDESALTGESYPISKNTNYQEIEDFESKLKNIKEYEKEEELRTKLAYMDSNVISGRGIGVVIDIGMSTAIGKIATMIQTEEEETPLQKNVAKLGKNLGLIAIIVCIIVFISNFIKGAPLVESFMTSVSLAVAAIPEGLPAILTLTLAIGMQRMAKSQAIVKRLLSVETLGSCTVVCSDKTGTLTENKMQVRDSYLTDNEKSLKIAGLCTNSSEGENGEIIGDPTDGAVMLFAKNKNHVKEELENTYPRIKEIPLDSTRKRMTTVHENTNNDSKIISSKGAPEIILEHCKYIAIDSEIKTLDAENKKIIKSKIKEMSDSALRVLGLGYKEISKEEYVENKEDNDYFEKDLIFTGLLGMMDPPKEEVKDAIANCQKAGIKVIMITGDHPDTAVAIGKEVGIIKENNGNTKNFLTGQELDQLSDEEYEKIIQDIQIYGRVYPEQKMRIIEMLQKQNEIVSMTGDGVNDAPALKKASIGVAMGSGTDVAKESADMIIQDDNFTTIINAIKEGRTIFDNLKRFLKFQLSTNIGAIITITIGSLLPIPAPLNPIQILWINIIMDGPPAQSLGLEGPERNIMERKPEKGDLIDKNDLIKITISGIVMAIGTLALFYWELIATGGPISSATTNKKAATVAFTVFVMFQLFNALNNKAKSDEKNNVFWIAILISFVLQILVIYMSPLQEIFRTTAIGFFDWILIFIVAAMILVSNKITNKIIK